MGASYRNPAVTIAAHAAFDTDTLRVLKHTDVSPKGQTPGPPNQLRSPPSQRVGKGEMERRIGESERNIRYRIAKE